MPQPYRGDGHVLFAAAVFMERPELGGNIAAIGTLWTVIEDPWGAILGMMVGVEQSEAGIAIFQSLTGSGAQRAVLNDMAALYLPEDLLTEYQALMARMKAVGKERNAIVHGLWFHDPRKPDLLILAPRHTYSNLFKNVLSQVNKVGQEALANTKISQVEREGWRTYTKKDFLNTIRRLYQFAVDLDHFFDRVTVRAGLRTFGPPSNAPLLTSSDGTPPQTDGQA